MKDTLKTLIEEVQANKIITISTLGQTAIASGSPNEFVKAVTNSSINAALNIPMITPEGTSEEDVQKTRQNIAAKIEKILGGLVFTDK